MRKQLLSVMLAGTMAMALAGCGSKQAAPAETTAAAAETQAESKEETQAESKEEAKAEGTSTVAGDASKSTWPNGTVQLYVPASAGGDGPDCGEHIRRTIKRGRSLRPASGYLL